MKFEASFKELMKKCNIGLGKNNWERNCLLPAEVIFINGFTRAELNAPINQEPNKKVLFDKNWFSFFGLNV